VNKESIGVCTYSFIYAIYSIVILVHT